MAEQRPPSPPRLSNAAPLNMPDRSMAHALHIRLPFAGCGFYSGFQHFFFLFPVSQAIFIEISGDDISIRFQFRCLYEFFGVTNLTGQSSYPNYGCSARREPCMVAGPMNRRSICSLDDGRAAPFDVIRADVLFVQYRARFLFHIIRFSNSYLTLS